MQTATRNRPSTSAPSDGSRTMTITNDPTRHEGEASGNEGGSRTVQPTGVLRLRAKRSGNRVAWGEDVVDNEGAGKKKSKICCIYHKPKRYDESSDESSDSEDEHSHNHASHSHSYSHPNGHSHGQASAGPSQQSQSRSEVHTLDLADDEESNAYEQGPGRSKGKGKRNAVP